MQKKWCSKTIYGFDETFNNLDDIGNKHNKLNEYKPMTSSNTKNVMLQHFENYKK